MSDFMAELSIASLLHANTYYSETMGMKSKLNLRAAYSIPNLASAALLATCAATAVQVYSSLL